MSNHKNKTLKNKFNGFENFVDTCKSPSLVREIVCDPINLNTGSLRTQHWYDLSLVDGFPSLVVFYSMLDKVCDASQGYDIIAHEFILEIKKNIELNGIPENASLFSGVTGLCYAVLCASRNRSRYKKVLNALENEMFRQVELLCIKKIKKQLQQKNPVNFKLYDVISGITGIGLYLVKNQLSDRARKVLIKILELCTNLTSSIEIQGNLVPGWFCSPEFYPQKEHRKVNPNGIFNMGLSHGVPSLLGLMAIALHAGFEVQGQREAMMTVIDWLRSKVTRCETYSFFQSQVTFSEQVESRAPSSVTTLNREAWCYGTPGVARVLYLAGKSLDSESTVRFSQEVFLSIFKRPYKDWNLAGPTFCHGFAGTLLITSLMAKDLQSDFLFEKEQELKKKILSFYDQKKPFGFCDFDLIKNNTYHPLNKTSLLTGATGTWLTLLTLEEQNISDWYYPFMVSYA